MSDALAHALLDAIAADPAALERLRQLVGVADATPVRAPAYTVASLAAELGRSERSIRAAIARGELQAVKRGRGYVIGADAVERWASGGRTATSRANGPARQRRPVPGAGPMRKALKP